MGVHFTKPEWLKTVIAHEENLRFESFCNDDALKLGCLLVDLAKTKFKGNAAVRIVRDGSILFAHQMESTGLENVWWMQKKQNVCDALGMSSLRACLETEYNGLSIPWESRENEFALCGGCFPLRYKNGEFIGYALVSGLPHEQDHQLIADGLAEYLGITIERIV